MSKRVDVPPSKELGGTVVPPGIMEEIISCVPAEELEEMKKVSISWFNTISDMNFTGIKHLHAMRKQNRVGFILQSQIGFYPVGYEPQSPGFEGNKRSLIDGDPLWYTLGSCNGFILNCTFEDRFFVCNPMNYYCWEILNAKVVFPEGATYASAFFDLGCVPGTTEYKVVRIMMLNTFPRRSEVQCYSTKTGVWKPVGEFTFEYPVWASGVYVDGCINWQLSTLYSSESIASFCCKKETFRHISLPDPRERILAYGDVGAVGDDKLMIYSGISYSFEEFKLWILENFEDDTSWKRVRFKPGYPLEEDEIILGIQPLRLLGPCGRRLLVRVEPSGRYTEYDLIETVYIPVEGPRWQQECCSVFPFIQSLARLV